MDSKDSKYFALFKKLTLSTQVVVAALVCAAVGLTAAYLGSVSIARATLLDSVSKHLRSRSAVLLDATRHELVAHMSTLTTWASVSAMQETLDNEDPKFAEDYMIRAIDTRVFTMVMLLDASDTVVAAVELKDGSAQRVSGAMKGTTILIPGSSKTTGLGITNDTSLHRSPLSTQLIVSGPVIDFAGDIVGHVVAVVSRTALEQILIGGAATEGEGQLFPVLFEESRRIVISPRPNFETYARKLSAETWNALIQGNSRQSILLGEQEYLAFAAQAPAKETPRFMVVTLSPVETVMAPLSRLERIVLSMFAVVLVALGAMTVVLMRRTTQPLGSMIGSLETVSRGDLTVRLPSQPAKDLDAMASAFNSMVEELGRTHKALGAAEAVKREVEIAHTIQTTVLPRTMLAEGFEIAASSTAANDVGGDYYDMVKTPDSFWVIMGDVSGHGLNSGLIMLMAQAAGLAAIRANPSITPAALVCDINAVLHENIRNRMKGDDYLTIVVAKHRGDGRFVGSGAHCPMFIMRRGGEIEEQVPMGAWCGVMPDIARATTEFEFTLAPGEAFVLLTDGVLEATNSNNELFGEDRVREILLGLIGQKSPQVLKSLLKEVDRFAATRTDDVTAMVVTRLRQA